MAPPLGVSSVSVPVFTNKTFEPGVERIFTEVARAELLRRNVVKVLSDGGDALFMGRVVGYSAAPSGLSALSGGGGKLVPHRYRATATVEVKLVARSTGEVLWKDLLVGASNFEGGGAEGFEGITRKANQDTALRVIAQQVMREAVDRMLADF